MAQFEIEEQPRVGIKLFDERFCTAAFGENQIRCELSREKVQSWELFEVGFFCFWEVLNKDNFEESFSKKCKKDIMFLNWGNVTESIIE
jgi:hypothetical protein